MRQHHPLRRPRRPARVLEKRERLPVDVGPLPPLRPVRLELGIDLPEDLPQARRRGPQAVEAIEDVAGREGNGGIGVAGDRLDPLNRPILPRRVRRNRDRTAIQAAEKRSDEVEPRGKKEEDALPGHPRSLEPGTERPGLPVELGVGDVELVLLAVDEERERPVMGAVGRPLPQQVDDRFGERRFGVGIGIHVPWDLRPPTVLEGLPARRLEAAGTGTVLWKPGIPPGTSGISAGFPGLQQSLPVGARQPEVPDHRELPDGVPPAPRPTVLHQSARGSVKASLFRGPRKLCGPVAPPTRGVYGPIQPRHRRSDRAWSEHQPLRRPRSGRWQIRRAVRTYRSIRQ